MAMLIGSDVTVLGGGIGGLAAGLALAVRGAHVTVLEQADAIKEVGAGIQVSPNGVRVLDALGIGDRFRAIAMQSRAVSLCDYASGADVLRMPLPSDPGTWLVHRADLVTLLADVARAEGVQIRLLQKVDQVEIEADGRASLRLNTGGVLQADLLIGADGLHSPTRRAVAPPSDPFFTGQVAWRMLVPAAPGIPSEARLFMGPGRHLVTYPLRGGTLRNIVAVEEQKTWAREGWTHAGDPARVVRAFSAFAPEIRGWLSEAREVHLWGLFRHPVAPRWHMGRAAILGDAAHPTLPFLAQGACMALEDAWVLAACMAEADTVEAAFERYQDLRLPRCRRIVEAATKNATRYHLAPGPIRSLAHGALRAVNAISPDMALRQFDWVYSADVTQV